MHRLEPWSWFSGILLIWSSLSNATERSCHSAISRSAHVSATEQSGSTSTSEELFLLQTEQLNDLMTQLRYITEDEQRLQMYAFPRLAPVRIPHIAGNAFEENEMPASRSSTGGMCPLPWNKDPMLPGGMDANKPCPHGKLLPGQVTLPTNASFREWFSVFYSYVVYALLVLVALECVFTGPLQFHGIGTREASFVLFAACIVVISEWPLRLFMHNVRPDLSMRPEQSCNIYCGMPSISSTLAIGFLTLSIMDASFRVLPKMPRCAEDDSEHDISLCNASFWDFLSFIPICGADMITLRQLCAFVTLWSLALLPVPFARSILHDHTMVQLLVGSVSGTVSGLIWFGVMRLLQKKYNGKLGDKICWIFEHNYPLPRYEVKIRCARLLLEGAPEDEVKQAEQELQWYMDEGRLEKQMGEVMARLTGKSPSKSKGEIQTDNASLVEQDSF